MDSSIISDLITQIVHPGCFLVRGDSSVRVEHKPDESLPWEIYNGHLLGEHQTRSLKTFETWNVIIDVPTGSPNVPLILVLLDPHDNMVYVTRSVLCHGWESYEESGMIQSKETKRWVRELVGSIDAPKTDQGGQFGQLLNHCLFLAVIGTDRLPVSSIESPLPAHSLGRLGFAPVPELPKDFSGLKDHHGWLRNGLPYCTTILQSTKLIESTLRAASWDEVRGVASIVCHAWPELRNTPESLSDVFRLLFNQAALSPHTEFIGNWTLLLEELVARKCLTVEQQIELLSYYLRHLVRHLTAFDLSTFHNRGANYPDALALDSWLRALLKLATKLPGLFEGTGVGRIRRRAFRQAILMRHLLEGLPVPEQPTSPGENTRVMPAPYDRQPDEVILDPRKREKRLFSDSPTAGLLNGTARSILQESIKDIAQVAEFREMGMATFLDRPLGILKPPVAVDRTPLLSYEVFSLAVASRRFSSLRELCRTINAQCPEPAEHFELAVGLALNSVDGRERPGSPALADAFCIAPDFQFLRTTTSSLTNFLEGYDLVPIRVTDSVLHEWLTAGRNVLLIRSEPKTTGANRIELTAYDDRIQPRVRLSAGERFIEHAAREYAEEGLSVDAIWDRRGGLKNCTPFILKPNLLGVDTSAFSSL